MLGAGGGAEDLAQRCSSEPDGIADAIRVIHAIIGAREDSRHAVVESVARHTTPRAFGSEHVLVRLESGPTDIKLEERGRVEWDDDQMVLRPGFAPTAATNVIAHGTAAGVSLAAWHRLELAFTAGNVSASLDGKPLGGGALGPTSATTGMVELQSGWHVAEFDNFALVSK